MNIGGLVEAAELLKRLNALASPQRLNIIRELCDGPLHVSDLARQLGVSRPLLYMHISRLEEAGFVRGELKINEDGRLHKYFENVHFSLELSPPTIAESMTIDRKEDQNE